jgi:hypothetical protein
MMTAHLDCCRICGRSALCFNPGCSEDTCPDCEKEQDELFTAYLEDALDDLVQEGFSE